MADAWGGAWGSAWGVSWGSAPPSTSNALGGTVLQRGGRHHTHHPTFTKKDYYELIEKWAREAAAKTAAIVGSEKTPKPTKRSIVAVAKRATADEAIGIERIWAETAARIAEIEEIDSKYRKMADALAEHFAKLAEEREQEDEDEIALLLS